MSSIFRIGLVSLVALSAVAIIHRQGRDQPSSPTEQPNVVVRMLGEESAQATEPDPNQEAIARTDQASVKRNGYLGSTMNSLDRVLDGIVCQRSSEYRNLAKAHAETTGGSQENFLLEKSRELNIKARAETNQWTAFDGTAEQQAIIRPLVIDQLALMQALQSLYTGNNTTCDSVSPFSTWAEVEQFLISAEEKRAYEQQRIQDEPSSGSND